MKEIDLNRFYQTYPLIDAATGEQSKRYIWVQDRSNNDCKENIFDVKNGSFVIDKWYDIVGRGEAVGNCVYFKKNYVYIGQLFAGLLFWNKADITNGKLYYETFLYTKDFIDKEKTK